eukprot:scaffold10435_cov69-Cyclotella_meneghiniana.AAC.4
MQPSRTKPISSIISTCHALFCFHRTGRLNNSNIKENRSVVQATSTKDWLSRLVQVKAESGVFIPIPTDLHIYEGIEVGPKSCRSLTKHGICTVHDLLNITTRIENGKLGDISDDVKEKLIKAAEWRSLNADVVITKSFTKEVFVEFCKNRMDKNSDVPSMCGDMKHICKIVNIPPKSCLEMRKRGILNMNDFINAQKSGAMNEILQKREDLRRGLMQVLKWRGDNSTANILKELNQDTYDDIMCKGEDRVKFAHKYIRLSLGRPFKEANQSIFKDVEADKVLYAEVVTQAKNIIMESPNLREECGKFDYGTVLEGCLAHFHKLAGHPERMQRIQAIQGDTQSKKTPAGIGVPMSMGGYLKVPVVVLTKGVDESIDLTEKIKDLTKGTLTTSEHVVFGGPARRIGMTRSAMDMQIKSAFDGINHSGVIVISDTEAQVKRAIRAIEYYLDRVPGGHIILIEDEADAMYRTIDSRQKFEQAFIKLQELASVIFKVTATPESLLPLLVESILSGELDERDIDFTRFEPQESYISVVEDVKPLEVNDKKIYFEQNEVNIKTEFTSGGVTVGYANDKTFALYDDAVSHPKGVCVLDVSCPRVRAENNILDKGKAVQAIYLARGIRIISITFAGSGIDVLLPSGLTTTAARKIPLRNGDEIRIDTETKATISEDDEWSFSFTNNDWQRWRNSLIGEVIECMDVVFGLNVPIFKFGYRKMCRCISFRSNRRVPTHMVMMLGRGYSIGSVIQTLGRNTGNSRSELKENGFDSVTILTTREDLNMAVRLRNYLKEINDRIQRGETFAQAVTGGNAAIPDDANFLRTTYRKIGQIKGLRKQFEEMVIFDKSQPLNQEEKDCFNEKYGNDADAQMLLRCLMRLASGEKANRLVHIDDIKDDLEEMEPNKIAGRRLRQLLGEFVDKCLLKKDGKAWIVANVTWLGALLFEEEEDDYDNEGEEDHDDSCEFSDRKLSEEKNASATSLPAMISHASQINVCDEKSVSSLSISAMEMQVVRKTAPIANVSPEKSTPELKKRKVSELEV